MGEFAAFRDSNGIYCTLIYQDSNLRIREAQWSNPTSGGIRLQIWDTGNLVYDNTFQTGSGTENVPGNYQLREVIIDPDLPSLMLPVGVTYVMRWPV